MFFGQPKSKKGHNWPGQKKSADEVILSGCIYANSKSWVITNNIKSKDNNSTYFEFNSD